MLLLHLRAALSQKLKLERLLLLLHRHAALLLRAALQCKLHVADAEAPTPRFAIVKLAAQRVTPNADANNAQALDATKDEGDAEALSLLTPRPASKLLNAGVGA